MKLYIEHKIKENQQLKKEVIYTNQYIQKKYGHNTAKRNRLVLLCTHILLSSHKELEELTKYGIPNQFLTMITDKDLNKFISTENNNEELYYKAQQILQFFALQNYITYETIILVENQLNRIILNFDRERERNFESLQTFFQAIKCHTPNSSINENEELSQKLIEWESQFPELTYSGIEYFKLHPITKLCCVSNDFFHLTEGDWATSDLLQMKSVFFNYGFPIRAEFSLNDFIEHLVIHPSLIKKLLKGIDIELLNKFHPCELPSLKAAEKIMNLQEGEHHIVKQYRKQEQFRLLSEQSLIIFLAQDYMKEVARIRGIRTISFFNFFIDIVESMKILTKS